MQKWSALLVVRNASFGAAKVCSRWSISRPTRAWGGDSIQKRRRVWGTSGGWGSVKLFWGGELNQEVSGLANLWSLGRLGLPVSWVLLEACQLEIACAGEWRGCHAVWSFGKTWSSPSRKTREFREFSFYLCVVVQLRPFSKGKQQSHDWTICYYWLMFFVVEGLLLHPSKDHKSL